MTPEELEEGSWLDELRADARRQVVQVVRERDALAAENAELRLLVDTATSLMEHAQSSSVAATMHGWNEAASDWYDRARALLDGGSS